MRLMRIMGLALFGALFAMVLAAGHPANAAGFKVTSGDLCQAVVDENLRKLAIDANDVRRLQFSPTYEHEDAEGNRRRSGTDVWVRLQSCQGALVIDLTRACRVRQVYTRGGCRLPGIKSSC